MVIGKGALVPAIRNTITSPGKTLWLIASPTMLALFRRTQQPKIAHVIPLMASGKIVQKARLDRTFLPLL
jgi:hypothetical protein